MQQAFLDEVADLGLGGPSWLFFWLDALKDGLFTRVANGFNGGLGGQKKAPQPGRPKQGPFGGLVADLLFAIRGFRKQPLFSVVVVATFALGISINTAVFSLVDGVLLRPLAYEEPEELVMIWDRFEWLGGERTWVHDLQVRDLRANTTRFEEFAAMGMVSGRILGGDRPVHTDVARVSVNFFDMLGVQPVLGRSFREGEDVWRSPWVVMLSHDYWTREFGQDPNVIGRKLVVGYPEMEVVGVLPEDFDYRMYEAVGQRTGADLWIPHMIDYGWWETPIPGAGVAVLARLKDGVSLEEARTELAQLARQHDEKFFENSGFRFEIVALYDDIVNGVKSALFVLIGAVVLVLLIATANITTLLLARTQKRTGELAVRSSLGASRLRLARLLLTENLTLATVGGGLGILLAMVGVDTLVALAPPELPRTDNIQVDGRVLGFSILVTLVAGALSALAPIWLAGRHGPAGSLLDSGRSRMTNVRSQRIRDGLVVAEFALSTILLAGAGLMVRSFVSLTSVDTGFESESRLTFSVYLMDDYEGVEPRYGFFTELQDRIEALPGVLNVGSTSALPLSATGYGPVFGSRQDFSINQNGVYPGQGIEPPPGIVTTDDWTVAAFNTALPGYVDASGINLKWGREFRDSDDLNNVSVVMIDEQLASDFFSGRNPVGDGIWVLDEWRTVVGVVGTAQHVAYGSPARPQVYFPYGQVESGRVSVVVTTSGDPLALMPAIREQVAGINPLVPVADVRTMKSIVDESLAGRKFIMMLMTAFAVCAIVLAAIGIFGVLSFLVSQRRREIAVRIAVGAGAGSVARLVVLRGVGLAVFGSGIGLALSLGLSRGVESMLYDVTPRDPVSFALAFVSVLVVGVLATWTPARRAVSVDPATILREE